MMQSSGSARHGASHSSVEYVQDQSSSGVNLPSSPGSKLVAEVCRKSRDGGPSHAVNTILSPSRDSESEVEIVSPFPLCTRRKLPFGERHGDRVNPPQRRASLDSNADSEVEIIEVDSPRKRPSSPSGVLAGRHRKRPRERSDSEVEVVELRQSNETNDPPPASSRGVDQRQRPQEVHRLLPPPPPLSLPGSNMMSPPPPKRTSLRPELDEGGSVDAISQLQRIRQLHQERYNRRVAQPSLPLGSIASSPPSSGAVAQPQRPPEGFRDHSPSMAAPSNPAEGRSVREEERDQEALDREIARKFQEEYDRSIESTKRNESQPASFPSSDPGRDRARVSFALPGGAPSRVDHGPPPLAKQRQREAELQQEAADREVARRLQEEANREMAHQQLDTDADFARQVQAQLQREMMAIGPPGGHRFHPPQHHPPQHGGHGHAGMYNGHQFVPHAQHHHNHIPAMPHNYRIAGFPGPPQHMYYAMPGGFSGGMGAHMGGARLSRDAFNLMARQGDFTGDDYEALSRLDEAKGVKKTGLSKEQIKNLPARKGGEGGEAADCIICMDAITKKQHVTVLPGCMHAKFHKHCISKWLSSHATCPLCQEKVVVE